MEGACGQGGKYRMSSSLKPQEVRQLGMLPAKIVEARQSKAKQKNLKWMAF
ncbi:hypothetical protein PT974_02668 [Cladobotryum mycophilum]|uniref:Uncharacterized protein n=1 Tax=Cladobotryum mycophilum TaxID=491253 RepID=A0ABR0SYS6_9HYPO